MNLSTTEIVFSRRIQGRDTLQDEIYFVRSFHNSSLISFVQRITKRNNRNKGEGGRDVTKPGGTIQKRQEKQRWIFDQSRNQGTQNAISKRRSYITISRWNTDKQ